MIRFPPRSTRTDTLFPYTTRFRSLTFTLAAAIGALSGMLIAPVTTVYYDTGFLIGLKGFVAAIFGGLISYPVAAGGALFVGILEAFSSFWASAYKEVIVFTDRKSTRLNSSH